MGEAIISLAFNIGSGKLGGMRKSRHSLPESIPLPLAIMILAAALAKIALLTFR
jgi:hypothetical protein